MSSAAAAFPHWVMLERFVFRRDGDESFPDDTKAPIRASATTSWGARFRIAFSLAEPPHISRLYAQLPEPGFLDAVTATPLAILGTHRHLALLRVATETSECLILQNFFIYSADENTSSSLKALPPCAEPYFDYTRLDGRLPRRRRPPSPDSGPRLLTVRSMGLWCPGEDEFVVAELTLYKNSRTKVFADICLLRSRTSAADAPGDQLGGTWNSMRVDFLRRDNPDDAWQLCCWETDTVIPFHQWLCWIDYCRGILFCDVSKETATPTVSFLRFPLREFPSTNIRTTTRSHLYRGVSVVYHGRGLKFVNVTRHDGIAYGALKPGTGFTITCHTLVLGSGGSMAWEEDYTVTSSQLWDANPHDLLPHDILMFPQADIDRPHVVHFLFSQFGVVNKKMWVVSIDMSTKTVESFSPYIHGNEGLQTDDADLITIKSMAPMAFLPCEFTKFLNTSRKKMRMD